MKKLFVISVLLFFVLYPPNNSEGKSEKKTIKSSIANFEKINHETLVNQFFREFNELNERVIKTEDHLIK